MNIEEIKKRVKEEFYIKRDIDFYEAQEDISYMLSIIEQAEKALESVTNAPARETMRRYAQEALQAIRKGD